MKKFIISTVFTVFAAFIFMVSFSMVSGVNNSYAMQGMQQAGGGKTSGMSMAKKNAKTNSKAKTSKTKNAKSKSKAKEDLNKMGAGCL